MYTAHKEYFVTHKVNFGNKIDSAVLSDLFYKKKQWIQFTNLSIFLKFPCRLLILGIRFCLILIFDINSIAVKILFFLTHKANIGKKVDLAANINVYQRNCHAHGKFWD